MGLLLLYQKNLQLSMPSPGLASKNCETLFAAKVRFGFYVMCFICTTFFVFLFIFWVKKLIFRFKKLLKPRIADLIP
jgi:hypothetical protein